MCSKCRAVIRGRAIAHYMDTAGIPVEMRAVFERGAMFGELQAALFVEKVRLDHMEALANEGKVPPEVEETVRGIGEKLGLSKEQVDKAIAEADKQLQADVSGVETVIANITAGAIGELHAHLEQEGLTITYGKPNLADVNNYNSLRVIHQLPVKELHSVN